MDHPFDRVPSPIIVRMVVDLPLRRDREIGDPPWAYKEMEIVHGGDGAEPLRAAVRCRRPGQSSAVSDHHHGR